MTGRKKHLRVLKDLRIQHEAYISTDPNAKMYEKEDKDIADALDYVISVLEQEPILDKIRAEIFAEMQYHSGTGEEVIQAYADGLHNAIRIIDKYKAEMGDT